MIDSLIDIDKQVFVAIHNGLVNTIFDVVMPFLREAYTWIPLYLTFVFFAIKKYKVQGLYIILATVLVVVLCDRFSAGFMKPYFERLRPCHEPSISKYIRSIIDCGGQFGFISSHATNHFGMAVMFTWFFKKISKVSFLTWVFYAWAGLVSFAQIYVGKHYPGDVLFGALCGFLIGWAVLFFFKKLITFHH